MAAPTLLDHQFQYGDSGVLLNSTVTTSAFFDVNKVTGLDHAPFRVTEKSFEGMAGGYLDAEFSDMRTVIIEGTVYAPSGNADLLEAFLDDLKENYRPNQPATPLYFRAGTVTTPRILFCKSLGIKYDWDQARRWGSAAVQIQLKAEDPAIYGLTENSSVMSPATPTIVGRGYNKAYNHGYGGPMLAGAYILNNQGNKATPWTVTFTNVTNPLILNDTTGEQVQIMASAAGATQIVVDMRARTVTKTGGISLRNAMTAASDWFYLEPGANNIRFRNFGVEVSPQATYAYRDAYE